MVNIEQSLAPGIRSIYTASHVPVTSARGAFYVILTARFESSRLCLLAETFVVAALILARCKSENPPELVEQSRFGFALQRGQVNEMGLTGRMSGISASSFAIPKVYARGPRPMKTSSRSLRNRASSPVDASAESSGGVVSPFFGYFWFAGVTGVTSKEVEFPSLEPVINFMPVA